MRYIIITIVFMFMSVFPAMAQDNDSIIDSVMSGSEALIYQTFPSPDERLQAEIIIYDCTVVDELGSFSYESLELIDVETGERQRIGEQLISCGGLGTFGLLVLRWSDDSRFLYYTDSREGVPDGWGGNGLRSIYRVDVESMQTERFREAAFSPDGHWIVVYDQESIILNSTDGSQRIDFPFTEPDLWLTNLIWLPDSSGVLAIVADQPFLSTTSMVILIDIRNLSQSVLHTSP